SRPSMHHLVEAGSYSFPSGHAMVSAAFYGMLGYLIWLNLRQRTKPAWYVVALTVLLIVAIGISRVYLGVHFPSDVIAGFAAGSIWLTACIFGLHAIRHYLGKKKNPPS
ncbi:phosphatase PAP2 family protein, partial [Frankia sp. Cpl3]|nr:phosphatase PAP2 family protein [Frankia sp. Cpl3]